MDQRSAYYNGIMFVDIDRKVNLPYQFDSDRIPNKGDILCFELINGNQLTSHHCVVLYVYDKRSGLGTKSFHDMEITSTSIFVVTKKIDPILGEEKWKSIYNHLQNNEGNI